MRYAEKFLLKQRRFIDKHLGTICSSEYDFRKKKITIKKTRVFCAECFG